MIDAQLVMFPAPTESLEEQIRARPVGCHCGGIEGPHNIGEGECLREWVAISDEPRESVAFPEFWIMPGGYRITDYTLKRQRLYAYHGDWRRWSRPKGGRGNSRPSASKRNARGFR